MDRDIDIRERALAGTADIVRAGPEIECSPDAPVVDRLVAYMGRTP